MNVLFVSPWYPDPPDNGAKLRISNLLMTLCTRHRVTLIAAHDPAIPLSPPTGEPLSLCSKVVAVPWLPQPVQGLRRFVSFLWPKPAWVFVMPSPDMRVAIIDELDTDTFDLVITYELGTLGLLPAFGQVPVILEDVELGGYLSGFEEAGTLERVRKGLFIWKLRRAVRSVSDHIAAYTVPSRVEAEQLRPLVSSHTPIEVVPNCIDGARYEGIAALPKPDTLIFTGSLTFNANLEAVTFFLREIFPLIKRELPDVQLCITGRHDNIRLPLAEQDASVRLVGFVDDVRPVIANSWVSVVPLLTGGGTRFKILESMALGTPVVTTFKGAEGLNARPGEHFLLADQPEQFAQAVVRLCQNQELRARLSVAGQRLVAENYTWQALAPRYLAWVEHFVKKANQ